MAINTAAWGRQQNSFSRYRLANLLDLGTINALASAIQLSRRKLLRLVSSCTTVMDEGRGSMYLRTSPCTSLKNLPKLPKSCFPRLCYLLLAPTGHFPSCSMMFNSGLEYFDTIRTRLTLSKRPGWSPCTALSNASPK
ncbi:hypothetical protein EJ04DRAFT_122643 [Polyplosphaeria fusca]|uniref:Uncharacterized protein n=1 Tax=Polyplosphaeria fusca TaxID=682080 RepID=A0A9P4QND0_9PLEO|nr:hypothetical protein EJ04DRAFT_122643 [Polyplosphaeria fusca]